VTASFRLRLASSLGFAAGLVFAFGGVLASAGCGDLPPPAAATARDTARTAPDDSDAWNLVPRAASSLADLDLVALRASPWSRALVTGGFVEDREARMRTFGYDVFNDADRMVVAAIDVTGLARQVVVVVGRFDVERIGHAFLAATRGAAETRWRDCRVWEGGQQSLGLVGRTLVQGTPDTVRAAIDAAWGVVPDARSGPLGALARDLGADGRRPAVIVVVAVTDDVRARAAGLVELPPGLERVGARLDLGADLDVDAQAVFGDGPRAGAAARIWDGLLRDLRDNRILRVMGLGPVIDGASLQPEGARVHGRLRIPEGKREGLSERLLFLLQTIARQRGQASPQP
jgi:hypothetical protein